MDNPANGLVVAERTTPTGLAFQPYVAAGERRYLWVV
jgi:hypothetical protein